MKTRRTAHDKNGSTLAGSALSLGTEDQGSFGALGTGAWRTEEVSLSRSERVVLGILKEAGRCMTTKEVTEEARKRNIQCPDSTAAFLSRLRMKKKIEASYSSETKAYVWWARSGPPHNDD